MPERWEYHERS